jgi:hypothetical protein
MRFGALLRLGGDRRLDFEGEMDYRAARNQPWTTPIRAARNVAPRLAAEITNIDTIDPPSILARTQTRTKHAKTVILGSTAPEKDTPIPADLNNKRAW